MYIYGSSVTFNMGTLCTDVVVTVNAAAFLP
jgi:hypothetical protein